MNIALTAFAFLSIAMLLTMIGCTANQPYRTNFKPSGDADPKAVIESHPDYKLGFVEFDDQGCFWDTRQLAAVEQMIRTEAGIPLPQADIRPRDEGGSSRDTGTAARDIGGASRPTAASQGIILVTFVHGWKHNAAYDSYGVKAFREILQQLSDAEHAREQNHPARKVVGVYAGWRGLSATWEPFMELSFWTRKDVAHKVGGYGALTELLVDLENIQKDSLDSLPPNSPRSELIIIGHSFGAAAVYSALSQIITERFVETVKNRKRLKPLGDQVILLNPAFEAIRHYDLNQMALAIKQYPADQRPVLSIFTSKGDWATHYVFPIGRFFSTIFERNRDNEQKAASRQTVGWFKPFITHELDYSAQASFPTSQASTFNLTTQKHEYHTRDKLRESFDHIQAERSKWHPNGPKPQTYYFDDSILKPIDGFHPGDPFLIVSVDKKIMCDHDDISNKILINFIREYIQFCQIDSKDHSK